MKRVKRKSTPLLKKHLEMQEVRLKHAISYPFLGKNIATTKGTFYSNREENNNNGYDGSRLKLHEMYALLEQQYEDRMWAHWKRQYPDGFPWDSVLKTTDGIVGKAMITSTVDLDDQQDYLKGIWMDATTEPKTEEQSALYRVFKAAKDNLIDNFGYKEEDEK